MMIDLPMDWTTAIILVSIAVVILLGAAISALSLWVILVFTEMVFRRFKKWRRRQRTLAEMNAMRDGWD